MHTQVLCADLAPGDFILTLQTPYHLYLNVFLPGFREITEIK